MKHKWRWTLKQREQVVTQIHYHFLQIKISDFKQKKSKEILSVVDMAQCNPFLDQGEIW